MDTAPRHTPPSTELSPRPAPTRWPLERVLFALAGSVTLVSAGLAAVGSRWFLLLAAFAGINQWLFVLFGACPASLILRRAFSLPSLLYPERYAAPSTRRCAAPAPRSHSASPTSRLGQTRS
jgi:hypothetical protein